MENTYLNPNYKLVVVIKMIKNNLMAMKGMPNL